MSVDTLEQVTSVAPEKQAYPWSANDRCDQPQGFKRNDGRGIAVSEQAYHRWTKVVNGKEQEIFFCNHHNNEHGATLFAKGWNVESSPQAKNLDAPLDVNNIDE